MKKLVSIIASCALLMGYATVSAVTLHNDCTTQSVKMFASSISVHCFKGNMKIKNSATVESTDNGLFVSFGGKTYKAYSSDRSGYSYMFVASSGVAWYFNY